MELKDDLKTLKKDLAEYKLRCDKADILTQEQKVIHPGLWKYYSWSHLIQDKLEISVYLSLKKVV